MSDKITKLLARFTSSEKAMVAHLLDALKYDKLDGIDIKKLKGHADLYRLRKGKVRVIYQVKNQGYKIILIDRRSEKTYRDF